MRFADPWNFKLWLLLTDRNQARPLLNRGTRSVQTMEGVARDPPKTLFTADRLSSALARPNEIVPLLMGHRRATERDRAQILRFRCRL